ncbi:dipeptidyl aminopeptidase/acylaminoacyl peptidase [Streptomyces sp. BK022]|uniref:S9 family peptidase n=1 Tax=Streptomyces sp. BK022 TaxID=2512123 RepID=UPI0010D1A311|nr:S9 family peptidase [Streptomyces sp. BK022]RZU45739.1 dipeptidyl aminopeptidase/acylaminoacyl peptidase [Streptomyces sp. BK022]
MSSLSTPLLFAGGGSRPHALPVGLSDLGEFKLPEQALLSPDGELVAVTVRWVDEDHDRWTTRLEVVSSTGHAGAGGPLAVIEGADAPCWSPDGTRLGYLARNEGSDRSGRAIHVWRREDGTSFRLTEGMTAISHLSWSPDGEELAFVAALPEEAARSPRGGERPYRRTDPVVVRDFGYKMDGVGLVPEVHRHLAVVSATTGTVRRLTSGAFDVQAPSWSPSGRTLVHARIHRHRHGPTAVCELAEVDTTSLSSRKLADWKGTIAWTGHIPGGDVIFAGQTGVGPCRQSSLYTLRPGESAPQDLLPDFDRRVMASGRGVTPAAVFVPGGRLLFCAREKGCTWVYALTLADGSVTPWVSGESTVVQCMDQASSSGRLALVISNAGSPGEVYTADERGDDITPVTALNRWLENRHVTAPEDFWVESPAHERLHGYLLRGRPAGVPGPTLVDIHGGPDNAWRPAFSPYYLYRQLLVDRGWNILMLNPRGSDGYGDEFMSSPLGRLGWSEEEDFTLALDALVRAGLTTEGRIAVMGSSHGGFMTNWLMARTERFAAGISVAGVCDWKSLHGTSSLGDITVPILLGGTPAEVPERYVSSSPLTYAMGVTAPTLLLHGEEDLMNPIGQSEQWFTALRGAEREVEFVRYPQAGHLFMYNGTISQQKDYAQRIVRWLSRHVGEPTTPGYRSIGAEGRSSESAAIFSSEREGSQG